MSQLQAVVKAVLSADTLVLRAPVTNPAVAPKERILHLEGITAPRLASKDREEEAGAFEAASFLRGLCVGKPVSFKVTSTAKSGTEFGVASLVEPKGQPDLAAQVIKSGWAKVRESTGDDAENERAQELRKLEDEAKSSNLGLWHSDVASKAAQVESGMPVDPKKFLEEYKGQKIQAMIELIISGSLVRARLLVSPTRHISVPIGLAGIRAPRASGLSGEPSEPSGDEAKLFLTYRLLHRTVSIQLVALPPPPQQPNLFLGIVHHPAGSITELLLESGLARVVDFHAALLPPATFQALRQKENSAKQAQKGIWKGVKFDGPKDKKSTEATVERVWGADLLTIRTKDGQERRVQLSSVRQPKPTDPKTAAHQAEGKELLRKKLIGKQVIVITDYIKPAEGDFEERECVTIKAGGVNVAEQLLQKGLLHLLRHKQDDQNRSSEYDKLVAAESTAQTSEKGVHGPEKKGESGPARIVEASENAQKAASFISSFKRQGKIQGVVDFVASGSRFKILIPKQDVRLTLVLSGIRAPRTARSANEKSEPYGQEALTFMSRKAMQRDVEFTVDATDRSGGFIGSMTIGKEDAATLLVKEGLAKVDDYSSDRADLMNAQQLAQASKLNLWKEYDAAAEEKNNAPVQPAAARKEYVDVIVSDVRGGGEAPFGFSVQILKDGGIPELEKLMGDLHVYQKDNEAQVAGFAPRAGDVVSAKFSADNNWYRAKVRRANPAKKEADIVFIDYGNSEVVPFSRLRPLPAQFKSLPSQSQEAALSFVTLLGNETEYGADALDRFRDLCEGRQLVANVDARDGNLLHLSFFDPKDPSAAASHESSINVQLAREGLARIDTRSRFRNAYPGVVKALDEAVREAKRTRAGAYELGDIFDDE